MKNSNIKPFFIFNPKSYLKKDELLSLTRVCDNMAKKYKDEITIFATGPNIYLSEMVKISKNAIISAQNLDPIDLGRGMGYTAAETLSEIGVKATFLNHAENQLTLSNLVKAIDKAKNNNIINIVCADSIKEAKAIALLEPEIILCEPTELIGTGTVSDNQYIESTNMAIRKINKDILVMQAAGISTPEDVYRTISLGADGTGCTSGVVKNSNPKKVLVEMIEALVAAIRDRSK